MTLSGHKGGHFEGAPNVVSPFSLPRGTVLRHGYEIAGILGRGGQGIVYLAACHTRSGRRLVALKVAEPAFLQREYMHLSALRHPGIPRVYELFEENGDFYLAHAVIRGPGSLRHWQSCWHGPPPASDVLQIGMQICLILGYLHKRRIVHCDLKPDNILFSGARGIALIDFGLAQHQDAPLPRVLGTPGYMAPEYERHGIVSPQTDLYSLGATLHDLLKGHAPEKGYRPHIVRVGLDPLEQALSGLLAHDPARRAKSAAEAYTLLLASWERAATGRRRREGLRQGVSRIVGACSLHR
jgi:serine/threonine protein kinase